MATTHKAFKQVLIAPKPYHWTRQEYYRLAELGFFVERRVELIEGEIIEMSPVYSPHATSVTVTGEIFREAFGRGWVIREEKPINLGSKSDPQPDVVIVPGKARDYKNAHPTTAALVVEVSDSSLAYDRKQKASLYAKSGIKDYWIVNLQERQVEVYRRPIADANAEYEFAYADKMIFKEGEELKPLAKPRASIVVADLLP